MFSIIVTILWILLSGVGIGSWWINFRDSVNDLGELALSPILNGRMSQFVKYYIEKAVLMILVQVFFLTLGIGSLVMQFIPNLYPPRLSSSLFLIVWNLYGTITIMFAEIVFVYLSFRLRRLQNNLMRKK